MIALLYETDKYLEIKQPIFWVGTSKKSTGRGTKIYEDKKIKIMNLLIKN